MTQPLEYAIEMQTPSHSWTTIRGNLTRTGARDILRGLCATNYSIQNDEFYGRMLTTFFYKSWRRSNCATDRFGGDLVEYRAVKTEAGK